MNTTSRIKSLTTILPKHSGRDNQGHVSVRHQGGRQKRYLRTIDFKREKTGISAKVISIEYDPNRTADIALLNYTDGEKRYILAPENLQIGDTLLSGKNVDIKVGNALPLAYIPIGTIVHNVELTPGKGAILIRSAGAGATVLSKDGGYVQIKMPSGEVRQIRETSMASIGQVGRIQHRHEKVGSAGRARRMGRRPTVRGVAQNPRSHPHGGGEGRSGIGMNSPKTPWGKHVGIHTRKQNKHSDRFIVKRRK